MLKGKFIVLYGINNLGKTTQAELLVKKLSENKISVELVKYPIYTLEPTGPIINEFLRRGNPYKLSSREAQILYAYNRAQFEVEINKMLNRGIWIVAEDYWGTGVAWGIGSGVDREFLLRINRPFQREDVAILLNGERFLSGKEPNHRHEDDDELSQKVKIAHEKLAQSFNWKIINANQTFQQVQNDIWAIVKSLL